MARLLRRLARVAVVLIGLLLIGLAVVHSPPVRGRVLERVRGYAAQELGITLQAASLGYNLFSRTIELRDLSLAPATGATPFLQADRVTVRLGPGLYLGRLEIASISAAQPRFTVVRDSDGTMNLPAARNDSPSSRPLRLGIVSVSGLSMSLDDRVARRSFALGPLDLSLDTSSATAVPGAFGPSGFSVKAGEVSLSGTLDGRLAFDGSRVQIAELNVRTPEGRVMVAGSADVRGERPAVSLSARATINLPGAARLARVDARGLAGQIEGTAEVTGPLSAPAVTFSLAGGDVEYPPLGHVAIVGRGSFGGTRLELASLELSFPAGEMHAGGAVELGSAGTDVAPAPSQLSLRWAGLRIDDLARAFGKPLAPGTGSLAEGTANIDFDVREGYPQMLSRVRATARTALQPVATASRRDTLGLLGRADLQVDHGRWSLRHSVRTSHAQASLEGTVTGRLEDRSGGFGSTLGGRSWLRVEDVAGVPPLMTAGGVSVPPDATDGLAGSLQATVDLAGTLEHPRARIELAARELRHARQPDAVSLDAQLDVDAASVRVQQARAVSGATALQAAGRYAWHGPLNATFEVNQHELSELASRFDLPAAVSGSALLKGTISGTVTSRVRSGQAALSLSAANVVVDQVAVGLITADSTVPLEDGGLMTIAAAAPDVGARAALGIVNRPGYPVSGDVALEHRDIARLIPPQYKEQIGDLAGRLSATARVSGLLSDPAGIRGRVDLRVVDVTARGTRIELAAPGTVTLAEDRIAIDSIDLRLGQQTRATLRGQLGTAVLPDPLKVHVTGPISELTAMGFRAAGVAPTAIKGDGSATFDLTIGGTLNHPLPAGTLAVRSPSLTYGTFAPVTALNVDAVIDATLVTLRTVTADWQGMSLAADGSLPWRVIVSSAQGPPPQGTQASRLAAWLKALPAEPSRARLTVRATNVTQAVLKDVLPPQQLREIQGAASATIVAEADRLTLDRLAATAVFDPASVTLAGVPFTQSVPTRLRLDNGKARIDDFQWTAAGNSIVASGAADLAAAVPSIDVGVAGAVDLRVLSAFVSGITSGGSARANLRIVGPFELPDIVGEVGIADGELQLDNPRLAATDIRGTLLVGDGRKTTVALTGLLNTGSTRISGTLDLADLTSPLGRLQFTGRNVALEYPSGLQTESNVDLELALGAVSTLSGRIDVLDGTYREALVLSSQLLNFSSASGIVRTTPPPEWLSRIRLNVSVATDGDIRVDNNYGRLDIAAALRIAGTAANPGVLGRLEAAEDGEIYLGGNTYRVERLTIDLTNPRAITPEVNFSAQTRIGNLPIGIDLRCPAAAPCERKVTSLATGIDDAEAEARLFGTSGGAVSAGENLARLLSGELLGVVGRTVGLDAIRLEQQAEQRDIFDDPTLISGDVDPASRLTLAKRLGSNVEVIYSQNLAEEGFTWITSYFGPFGLSWRLLVLDDQSRSYEFRHELPIGAGRTRRRPRPPAPRITAVRIEGAPGFPETEVRRHIRLSDGDRFTFAAWQADRDRLQRFYQSRGLLEARIRARRLPGVTPAERQAGSSSEPTVVLEYRITRGPATELDVRGVTLPADVRDRIAERWTTALFDGFLERDARTIVREHLYRQGYLDADVAATVTVNQADNAKTLTIDVNPGGIVSRRIDLTGNAAVPTETLLELASAADPLAAWLDAASVERALEDHYRSAGHLAADVSVGAPVMRDGVSIVPIQVVEGRPFSIGEVAVTGLPDGSEGARSALSLAPGGPYRPADVAAGIDRLEAQLRRQAYRAASTEVETRVDEKSARVDVDVRVTPGPRSILREVIVEGGDAGKPAVGRSVTLEIGAPLDPLEIRETRRRLYDLDVYRSVDIQVQPIGAGDAAAAAPNEQPVMARIVLEERPRYRVRYGLAVSDQEISDDERDRRLGLAADVENRNLFGRGATAGMSLRWRRDQQVGRLTLGSQRFFGLPLRSTVFIERQREKLNPEGAFPVTSDVNNVTAEQSYRLRRAIELRYGYAIDRNHTFIRTEGPDGFDLTVKVARLTTSGIVDRRDDPFNPARGWFVSSALELSRPSLGSDLSFLKNFAQYSQFFSLGPGMVLASAARLGLARTIEDEVLIPTERFFAGGANTVRGYRQDDLGPRSVFDDADGGEAMLVFNGELRFPIYRWLKGVGFVDVGNVYPKVRDMSLTDMQIGVGAGARFDTPFGLIRLDLGIPANRRSFDPKWKVHFGLGHAF